jgi:hypothetical protein
MLIAAVVTKPEAKTVLPIRTALTATESPIRRIARFLAGSRPGLEPRGSAIFAEAKASSAASS